MAGKGGTAGGGQAGAGGSGGLACSAPPTGSSYTVDATGVTFTLNPGRMKVQVCKEDVIRVTYTSATSIPAKTSLSVSATWGTPSFCVTESAGVLTIATSRMKAKVTESSGLVTYTDLADNLLVSENSKSLKAATVEGVSTNTVKAAFNSPANEALFGLGQHQDGVINRKGSTLHMLNANTQIQIPVLVSNKGYGALLGQLFDDRLRGERLGNTQYSFSSETGDMVDYYFFYGPTIDQVVANYRATTGAAPALPQVGATVSSSPRTIIKAHPSSCRSSKAIATTIFRSTSSFRIGNTGPPTSGARSSWTPAGIRTPPGS